MKPTDTVKDIIKIKETLGYSGIPITETGKIGGKLVGIVSQRDTDFIDNYETTIKDIMETNLTTAKEGVSLAEANDIMRKSKKGRQSNVEERSDDQ